MERLLRVEGRGSYPACGDGILTAYRPGTAMAFALTIVEAMCGKGKREEIGGPMMLAEKL